MLKQQQLSVATGSGSDKLQIIREGKERYRQERDGAKGQLEGNPNPCKLS